MMRDTGVIRHQVTGGEPLIDPAFPRAHALAHELGMQIEPPPLPSPVEHHPWQRTT
ncbi:hypothetical protein GR925_22780 [Streptomyces sp. HUCO-GS316]|uniref:hypothetical protein n=1 Tax=Streptomyces sp. HUCO-GS316 TaxID=2692198 RepID=UPI00136ED57A|nr:hypothetical protein [Streptomyces sp. HUCO-GS316]MXM66182.1 hypothetical protein [Streptomyces sp. HUCO-GS316]